MDVNESDSYIQDAKSLANIKYNSLGCGRLAMVSQFDFLARYAGYSSIAKNPDNYNMKVELAKEIFKKTPAIASDSFLGQLLGKDPGDGTFIFPQNVINGSRAVLENHHLAIKKTKIDEEGDIKTYYDRDSQIYVYGDTLPSTKSFETKKSNIIDSILKGMPVIWWTTDGAGEFSNHYMNIYGFEYWIGTDSNGQVKGHMMFKLRVNWGWDTVYMDSDTLDAINGGFIFFEETHTKVLINPEDYDYQGQYYFVDYSKKHFAYLGGKNFTTNRLRAGYVNHYNETNTIVDAQYLVLSAKRENANIAYLEYSFTEAIDWIYFDVRWWSNNEGIDKDNGVVLIQYKNDFGNWITAMDLFEEFEDLSYSEDDLSKICCRFYNPIYEFRIYVESYFPTGSSNKGRLVIGELNVFFSV